MSYNNIRCEPGSPTTTSIARIDTRHALRGAGVIGGSKRRVSRFGMSGHIRCRPAKPKWQMSYEYNQGADMLFCRTKYPYHNYLNVVRREVRTFQLMSYKEHASNGLRRRSSRGVRGARPQHLQTSDQQAERTARQPGQRWQHTKAQ